MSIIEELIRIKSSLDYYKELTGYNNIIEESIDVILNVQNGVLGVESMDEFYNNNKHRFDIIGTFDSQITNLLNSIKSIFTYTVDKIYVDLSKLNLDLEHI